VLPSDEPTVPLRASTMVRAIIRLLPPLPPPVIEIEAPHHVEQIAAPSPTSQGAVDNVGHGKPMRRVGEGIYFLDGVTIVTSDAFGKAPARDEEG